MMSRETDPLRVAQRRAVAAAQRLHSAVLWHLLKEQTRRYVEMRETLASVRDTLSGYRNRIYTLDQENQALRANAVTTLQDHVISVCRSTFTKVGPGAAIRCISKAGHEGRHWDGEGATW